MKSISNEQNGNDITNITLSKEFCITNAVINTSNQWINKYNTFINEIKIYTESINDYFVFSKKQLENYFNKTYNQTIACILSYMEEINTKQKIHSAKIVASFQESINTFLKEIKEAATEGKYKENIFNTNDNNINISDPIHNLQTQNEQFQLEITNLKSVLQESQLKNKNILLNSQALKDNIQLYLTNNESQIKTISTLNDKITNLEQEIYSLETQLIEKTTTMNQYKIQYEQAIQNNKKSYDNTNKDINELMKNIPEEEQKDFEKEKEEYTKLQKTIDDIKAEINEKQKEASSLNKNDPKKGELEKEVKDKKNMFLKLTKELIALKKKINDKKDKKK